MWNFCIADRVLHITVLEFILTNHVHFQTVLTCVSEMVMIGIAEEKFCNHTAVFTTSLTKLGELSLWRQKLLHLNNASKKCSAYFTYNSVTNLFLNYRLLTGCQAVKFLPQLSKLLYQLVHSMLLRDGKYSFQEHCYVHFGQNLPFALSTLG